MQNNQDSQTIDTAGLLKKKIKDLTKAEIEALTQRFGTSDQPFPAYGIQSADDEAGGVEYEQVLSLIASDQSPLKVYSERPFEDALAISICDLPTPSMLPYFFEGLKRRGPGSLERIYTLFGDPGDGKTFMAALHSRIQSDRPTRVIDCGGKNLADLLFEVVLDFGPGAALPDAIDKRAIAGILKAPSIGVLRLLNSLEPAPKGYKETEAGQKEWEEKIKIVSFTNDGRPIIDWDKLRSGSEEKITRAFELLKKVSFIEGLDNAGGNAMGINVQYGPAVRSFIEGWSPIYDEYNKSLEKSDDTLQGYLDFMMGGKDEFVAENHSLKNKDLSAGPSYFKFRREDMPIGHFVDITGNKKIDGMTTRELTQSAYSRLQPETLTDPTPLDWQHRICQFLTGMPISTLYHAFKNSGRPEDDPDRHPAAFAGWLMDMRKRKAELDGVPMPEHQERCIRNWPAIVRATDKVAHIYHALVPMFDIELLTKNGHGDLIDEVDKEFSDQEGIDFRKIAHHLQKALSPSPEMLPQGEKVKISYRKYTRPENKESEEADDPMNELGTRWARVLIDMAVRKAKLTGREKLYNKIIQVYEKYGLQDIVLMEGARSDQKSFEEELNLNSHNDPDDKVRADMAQKIFCNYLRQKDAEITIENEEIVNNHRILSILTDIRKKNTAESKEVFYVNRDATTLSYKPLATAAVVDTARLKEEGKEGIDFDLDDVVDHDDFLASLAMPTVGAKNLSAIWEQNTRRLVNGTAPPEDVSDEALNIAENVSENGIAVTSLQVAYKDEQGERTVAIDIVHNSQLKKTLIVSEKLPVNLKKAFNEAGIVHVDRHDEKAKGKIEIALRTVTRLLPNDTIGKLAEAFRYRTDVNVPEPEKLRISDMMISEERRAIFPKYIVKTNAG